jgi:hypothetical protein
VKGVGRSYLRREILTLQRIAVEAIELEQGYLRPPLSRGRQFPTG